VTGLLNELIMITHLIKLVLQPFLVKSVVISSCGTKRAIHLIPTTPATVATRNMQCSLDLGTIKITENGYRRMCSSDGYNLFPL